jgi:outer membrane protein assembly factor BamB
MNRNLLMLAFTCVWISTSLTYAGSLWASANTADSQESPLAIASQLVQTADSAGGVCSVLGAPDARFAIALAKQGPFVVQCLFENESDCQRAREEIRACGMYGRVSAVTFAGNRLSYAPNLINVLVLDGYPTSLRGGVSLAEITRVLTPLGTVAIGNSTSPFGRRAENGLVNELRSRGLTNITRSAGDPTWVTATKPWPESIDEWTHYLHGPDGNPVARDRVVGPPRHYQWLSGPMFQRSHETDSTLSTLVTARGRLFHIVDEAPISLTGQHAPPDKWSLVAQDAFNGMPLWKVPIRRWGWREWKGTWFTNRPGDFPLNIQKRLVAVDDKVFVTLGYHAPVSQLDARTGELLRTYDGTERTNEILYLDGTLILSLLVENGLRVMAVDAANGEQRWVTDKVYGGSTVDYLKWTSMHGRARQPEIDPSLNTATDGRVVALIDGPDIVGVDFATGAEKWRNAFPSADEDHRAGGINAAGKLWIGTMIAHDGVILHASPSRLAGLSADTGEVLWTQPKKYIGHLWYEWKDVFVIEGLVWTWSAELEETVIEIGGGRRQRELWPRTVNGYDLQSGELKKEVPLGAIFKTHHHHRCYRNKATLRYILASRRGTEFVDLEQGRHTVDNWVRGTCHVGMMPANGLQYAPPHPCACYVDEKLNGMNALAPASAADDLPEPTAAGDRLSRGPAFRESPAEQAAADADQDWPTFRHDFKRTGSVGTNLPDDIKPLWSVPLGSKISPPIAVADRVYVSLVDEHHVVCLNVADGTKLWEFAAGARIDSPPTYDHGSILFGSADGNVYCLRARDGALAWRFQAAPWQRMIGAFGQLESAWPVNGSVLVRDGLVYFAAGRSSQLDGGIYLSALEAATGELRHQRRLEGPSYTVDDIELNYRLPMGALPDILMSDGSTIFMRNLALDTKLQPKNGSPSLQTKAGFLEDSYFKRMPWTYGANSNYGRLLVHDEQAVYCVRMFDSLRGLDPTVFFTPGTKGYLLFAKNLGQTRDNWAERIPVRIRAMLLAADRLCVAGPPDVVDAQDPLGAFEGRQGGSLHIFDAASGTQTVQHTLASPPVFNGIAASRERLYVTHEDGSVSCFGK